MTSAANPKFAPHVGHYEVYGGEPFRRVMDETLAWYRAHLSAR